MNWLKPGVLVEKFRQNRPEEAKQLAAKPTRQRSGERAEQWAANWLIQQGCTVRERNYRCRHGEIDLIAEQRGELIIVEVRYRGSGAAVDAATSVDSHKQQRLIAAASHFLSRNPDLAEQPLRFDVLALSGSLNRPETLWIQDAFQ